MWVPLQAQGRLFFAWQCEAHPPSVAGILEENVRLATMLGASKVHVAELALQLMRLRNAERAAAKAALHLDAQPPAVRRS